MWRNLLGALALMITLCVVTVAAQGWSVVTDGRFTNIYVYRPDFPNETWDQHLAKLRPDDTQPGGTQFTRAAIDHFTDVLMTPGSPSYFDWLNQYSGIRPPRFFGSGFALQRCVVAAMKDAKSAGGVMQWDTIRSLANCHNDGEDPSPQVALIFSPDIKIGKIGPIGNSGDMCATKGDPNAWHAWGLNVPNFIALPTDPLCAATFNDLTSHLSHEIVETLSDPGTLGEGGIWAADPKFESEVGDKCNNNNRTTWSGFTVTQYYSNRGNICEPRVFSPPVSTPGHDWLDVSALPLKRFKEENDHNLSVAVNPQDVGLPVQKLQLIISTGGDDLRGGDNCDVTILLRNGGTIALNNVNHGGTWDNWTINTIDIPLPSGGLKGGDVTGIKLHKNSGGDLLKAQNPDNWNVQRIQLKAWFQVPDKIGPDSTSKTSLLTTTVTVTVSRIGIKPGTGPRRPNVRIYPRVKILDDTYAEGIQNRSFSRSVAEQSGNVPIEIEVWQNLPDYTPPPNCTDYTNPQCRPIHNAKAVLRRLYIEYNTRTHAFIASDRPAGNRFDLRVPPVRGRAGEEVVFPADGDAPEVVFTVSDQPNR